MDCGSVVESKALDVCGIADSSANHDSHTVSAKPAARHQLRAPPEFSAGEGEGEGGGGGGEGEGEGEGGFIHDLLRRRGSMTSVTSESEQSLEYFQLQDSKYDRLAQKVDDLSAQLNRLTELVQKALEGGGGGGGGGGPFLRGGVPGDRFHDF